MVAQVAELRKLRTSLRGWLDERVDVLARLADLAEGERQIPFCCLSEEELELSTVAVCSAAVEAVLRMAPCEAHQPALN